MSSSDHHLSTFEIEVVDEEESVFDEYQDIKRKTSPFMTSFECAGVIAARTLQLVSGEPPKIDPCGSYDPMEIAKRELYGRVLPLVIRRTLPDGTTEIWPVKEMHIRDH